MSDAGSNSHLTSAIASVLDAPAIEFAPRLRALLQELIGSTLVTGDNGEYLALEGEEGRAVLALFTDQVELHFFEPGHRGLQIPGEKAIRLVAAGEYDGLVLNPGVRQFELAREDVLEFFEIDPEPSSE